MENADDSLTLQKKLYFLLEQLQNMARDLPPKYQMRLPYELLSSLANCLLNETVFEIVKGLLEIQHVTEQHLYQQRLQFINQKKLQEQEILKQYEHDTDRKIQELQKFMLQQKEELKAFDMNLVLQLDQKVADQQEILEKAGVPGFYVTKHPLEIKVQMHLLDFLLRLSRMTVPVIDGNDILDASMRIKFKCHANKSNTDGWKWLSRYQKFRIEMVIGVVEYSVIY